MNNILNKLESIVIDNISDIHIKENNKTRIREGNKFYSTNIVFENKDLVEWISSILSSNDLNKYKKGYAVDCSIKVFEYRFRLNIYQDKDGINIAMRNISNKIPSLEEIEIPNDIKPFLLKEKGLILICGSSGSGKSTTLASMINFINQNKACHIVTLEDPIEYEFISNKSLINQIEIGKDSLSWDDAIKNILRQDPDVIMVGEIRNIETMSAVLTLAETGHLVFSTLHTISAIQALNRIIEIYPIELQKQICLQLSFSLHFIMSQKLIPNINNKKIATRDIFINTRLIAEHIYNKEFKKIIPLIETGSKYGMLTFEKDLVRLVQEGKINYEIGLKASNNPKIFESIYKSGENITLKENINDSTDDGKILLQTD